MSVSGITALGASSAYDFTNITPLQIQQAANAMESDGSLTAAEASVLSGLGSASSFSPIDGNPASLDTDTSWQSIDLNILSCLQEDITVGKRENLGPEGEQLLSTDQSLLNKLSAYQAAESSAGNATGTVISTSA